MTATRAVRSPSGELRRFEAAPPVVGVPRLPIVLIVLVLALAIGSCALGIMRTPELAAIALEIWR